MKDIVVYAFAVMKLLVGPCYCGQHWFGYYVFSALKKASCKETAPTVELYLQPGVL